MLFARRIVTPLTSFIRHFQVTVLGAASEVGQTVTLLLRAQPAITKLVTHDYQPESPGVLLDVSHVPAESALEGYSGEDTLYKALKGSDLVIATGGTSCTPDWSKKSCFNANATFIKNISAKLARTTPMPFIGIAAEPINSIVPMASEIMRNHGYYDGKRMFGITGVDLLRSQCLYAMENRLNPRCCYVPVIGGHSAKTIIPLFSRAKPAVKMDEKRAQGLTEKIRRGEEIITRAKMGRSPTLSVAYSVLVFVRAVLHALDGNTVKVQAYVENNDYGTSFFSGLVDVKRDGLGSMQTYNNLSNYECHLLEESLSELRKDIARGTKTLETGLVDVDY